MLGDLRRPTAFRDLIAGFIDAVSGFQETVEDQIADGDKVVTRISGRGTHTGELMGVAPSGNQLKWTAIVVSRFVGAKIAEEWAEFDALSFSQQLGASAKGNPST
jgi:predicted ester cyclase